MTIVSVILDDFHDLDFIWDESEVDSMDGISLNHESEARRKHNMMKLDRNNNAVLVRFGDSHHPPPDTSANIFKRCLCSALSENASIECIQSILDSNPDWLTRYGELREVVEHALIVKTDSPVLKLLIQHDPECVHKRSYDGPPLLLHVACILNAAHDVVELLLKLSPNDFVPWRMSDGMSHLHHACSSSMVSLDIIKLLVEKNPDSMRSKDFKGRLPLHVACLNKVSFEILHFLVWQEVALVREKEGSGRLPVHLACAAGASLEVVALLVECFPESVRFVDHSSNLPLHLACLNMVSFEVVQFLVGLCHAHVREIDGRGRLPVHLACTAGASLEVVVLLVETFPESVRVVDNSFNLPLHSAAEGQGMEAVFQYLLEKHPNGVREVNREGLLPLHLACSGRGTANLGRIGQLLDAELHTVLRKTPSGLDSLQLALKEGLPGEITEFLEHKQAEAIQAIHEAFDHAMEQCAFPDLVIAEIWKFAMPKEWNLTLDESFVSDDGNSDPNDVTLAMF